jgi:hypothetical protein
MKKPCKNLVPTKNRNRHWHCVIWTKTAKLEGDCKCLLDHDYDKCPYYRKLDK